MGRYTIGNDGLIEVRGSVIISGKNIFKLPLKFKTVTGSFKIRSIGVKTLKGCPYFVGRNFDCSDNFLTTLIGAPDYVGGNFLCYENELISLKGSPMEINGNYHCAFNKLQTLEFGPKWVGGSFNVVCNLLRDLTCCPDYVGESFYIDHFITTLYMGRKNCDVKSVKIRRLTRIDSVEPLQLLPKEVIMCEKYLPIIFKYNTYLDLWNKEGIVNDLNLKDIIMDIDEGLL